jgi:hypothetical protein
MNEELKQLAEPWKQRILEAKQILKKIHNDGYDEHSGIYEEALEYFLLDVLQDSDWERLKKEFKIK